MPSRGSSRESRPVSENQHPCFERQHLACIIHASDYKGLLPDTRQPGRTKKRTVLMKSLCFSGPPSERLSERNRPITLDLYELWQGLGVEGNINRRSTGHQQRRPYFPLGRGEGKTKGGRGRPVYPRQVPFVEPWDGGASLWVGKTARPAGALVQNVRDGPAGRRNPRGPYPQGVVVGVFSVFSGRPAEGSTTRGGGIRQ